MTTHRVSTYVYKLTFCTSNALATTLDQDFICLEWFACTTLITLSRVAREGDFDSVLIFKTVDIFTALADEGRMILGRNLQNFRGLVRLINYVRSVPPSTH